MKGIFRVKSIYLKFFLLFVGILWISSVIAFTIIFCSKWGALKSSINADILAKAEYLQSFYNKNHPDINDMQKLLEDEYTKISVFTHYSEVKDDPVYKDAITQAQFEQILSGKTLRVEQFKRYTFMPFVGIKVGDNVVFIHPRVNLMENFRGIAYVLLICACLGSFLIAIAARMIVSPIKKLTAATKEVAKGNFNIKVKTKSGDEIGQLTDNFNIMTDELKNMEYLRKDFISSVSHEFKTPITAIQGFAKLISEKSLTSEQFEEYTGIIISETGRLANLSSNLLRLSTLENQAIREKNNLFPLDEQIRRVILLLENKWSKKGINLDLDLDEVQYSGNEELLQQVWINLITNAVKFSSDGGIIKISLKKTENAVRVQISNNGAGIPDEAGDRIFEMFYKGDKSRGSDGSGLGLAIVKKIVELHRGRVFFESAEGVTTFTVELV